MEAERDSLRESVTFGNGEYMEDDDRQLVGAWTAQIDGYRALLASAGALPPSQRKPLDGTARVVVSVETTKGNRTTLAVQRFLPHGRAAGWTRDLGEWPILEHAVLGAAAMAVDTIYEAEDA